VHQPVKVHAIMHTPPNTSTMRMHMGQAKAHAASTARSVEDETRNGHRNAKRNPNRNHETIYLGLFSLENLKRDVKR